MNHSYVKAKRLKNLFQYNSGISSTLSFFILCPMFSVCVEEGSGGTKFSDIDPETVGKDSV